MERLVEREKVVLALAPATDRYNGNPATDVYSMRQFQRIMFELAQVTAGTNTGTATVTVEACDDVTPTTTEAIAFNYCKNESAGSADTFGAMTAATSAGFVTTANKTAVYLIEVAAADLPRGKPFVRLKLTETVNDPVTGVVLAHLGDGPKGAPSGLPTVIA